MGASLLGIGGVAYGISREVAAPGPDKACIQLDPQRTATLTFDEQVPSNASRIPWYKLGVIVDDASCVDETAVYGIVQVRDVSDIEKVLSFARDEGLSVTMSGARHSMGGHAFARGAIMLDMTTFNQVRLDEISQTVTVQPGVTWHQIQEHIHPKYAIMSMQSSDIFTVGGSISVNAHGMDHRSGAVENSIVSMRVLTPHGEHITVSRTEHPDYYDLIVGGYGLFGIITEVTLRVVPNDIYTSRRTIISTDSFSDYFISNIEGKEDIGLMYTHLSVVPGKQLLKEAIVYEYHKTDPMPLSEVPPLSEIGSVKLRRLVLNISKYGAFWQQLRWWSEKYLEPRMESCALTRANAQSSGEGCLVSRNEPMHDSVPYLKNALRKETDILHEYFIPRRNIQAFIDGLREIVERENVNLLNASIRVVGAERGFLTYADEDAFSVVLYINQRTTPEGHEKMKRVTQALIDLAANNNGRFFLPYQTHYTHEQLVRSYPRILDFFMYKQQYDPKQILTNTWYEKYAQ